MYLADILHNSLECTVVVHLSDAAIKFLKEFGKT
jgi:hypothetical protein